MSMIPGMSRMGKVDDVDEKELKYVEAIIQSMTLEERRHPVIINGSRRKRIAIGSGRSVQDVNKLLKQFFEMQKMMKNVTKGKSFSRMMAQRFN
jgi:signal recognition particle subunit SRP54